MNIWQDTSDWEDEEKLEFPKSEINWKKVFQVMSEIAEEENKVVNNFYLDQSNPTEEIQKIINNNYWSLLKDETNNKGGEESSS